MALLLFLALAGTALTMAVWYWLVQRDDVGRLGITLFLVPAVGLGLAFALFGERLDAWELVGVAFILGALVAVALERPTRGAGAGRSPHRMLGAPHPEDLYASP